LPEAVQGSTAQAPIVRGPETFPMPELWPLRGRQPTLHQVKANFSPVGVGDQVASCGLGHGPPFVLAQLAQRKGTTGTRATAAALDFYKGQDGSAHGDQVYFQGAAAPIARHDGPILLLEEPCRLLFPKPCGFRIFTGPQEGFFRGLAGFSFCFLVTHKHRQDAVLFTQSQSHRNPCVETINSKGSQTAGGSHDGLPDFLRIQEGAVEHGGSRLVSGLFQALPGPGGLAVAVRVGRGMRGSGGDRGDVVRQGGQRDGRQGRAASGAQGS